MFEWRKEPVIIFERRSKTTWTFRKGKLMTHKKSSLRKLQSGRGIRKMFIELQPDFPTDNLMQSGPTSFRRLFFIENGVVVRPTDTITAPFSALMRPEDSRDAEERSDLSELYRPHYAVRDQLMFWIMCGLIGGLAGYVAGNFYPMSHAATTVTQTIATHTTSSTISSITSTISRIVNGTG
jgi:hypothetical protein